MNVHESSDVWEELDRLREQRSRLSRQLETRRPRRPSLREFDDDLLLDEPDVDERSPELLADWRED